MGKDKESQLEKEVLELAERARRLLINGSVNEVVIPCTCVPIAQRIREYINNSAVGERQTDPYIYKIQLVTDKIQLDSLPQKDKEFYNLVIRRRK